MPLIRDGRFVEDDWVRVGADEADGASGKVIVPFDLLKEKSADFPAQASALGIEAANDTDPDALARWFDKVRLISVQFPKSADGRGYSIATRLRRLGYRGELRATGHIIADQYALARSCGFDTVEISQAQAERQPEGHWLDAQRAMTLAYQRGYGPLRNILTSRWASQ